MLSNGWDLDALFDEGSRIGDKYQTDEDRDNFQREMNEIRREFDDDFTADGYPRDGQYYHLED